MAALACALCSAYLFGIASPAVELLQVWWMEMLVYTIIPVTLTFTLLCGSHIHREMPMMKRAVFLFVVSVLMFAGVAFFLGAVVFFGSAFAGLARGHF